ncbi:MAG TPA: formate dehydrogenase, partial [Proteobacteria bacterium]|nr:formate dehydrogenase [Pseudomonadota bacterium]
MKSTVIDLGDNSFNRSVQDFMERLLQSDLVGSVMLPKKTTGGDNYVQALVKNPDLLADTDVTAPVIPVQAARLISNLTFSDPGEKIAVVVKPCEARALVELTKFQQINRESLLIIAVDCLGTYEPKDFSTMVKAGKNPAADLRKQAAGGRCEPDSEAPFRSACTICEYPT